MEQSIPHQGGELQRVPRKEQQPPTQERLTDAQLIYHGITEALRENRTIDHATARAIASQLHGGQASPLYALASSGALADGLRAELDTWRTDTPAGLEPWLDALDNYIEQRDDASPSKTGTNCGRLHQTVKTTESTASPGPMPPPGVPQPLLVTTSSSAPTHLMNSMLCSVTR